MEHKTVQPTQAVVAVDLVVVIKVLEHIMVGCCHILRVVVKQLKQMEFKLPDCTHLLFVRLL